MEKNQRAPAVAKSGEASFETAVDTCGIGCFTALLFLAIFPSIAAMVFASSNVSFILPTAECDLKLSLFMKGLLNAISYAGMILSAIPWGYLADVLGRKPVLVIGHFLDFAFAVAASLSQTTVQLLIFKFFNGFLICGPFATAMSYISEFHTKKNRAMVLMVAGMLVALSAMVLPVIAFFMLPEHTMFHSGAVTFHNWHYFLLTTSIPSLVSGILFIFLPESPKFLMAKGRGDEAYEVFSFIYALNKRKRKADFPFASLEDEAPDKTLRNRSYILLNTKCPERTSDKFKDGLKDLKMIFKKSYLLNTFLACFAQGLLLLALNSIRLWLPSIFVTTDEMRESGSKSATVCDIISYSVNRSSSVEHSQSLADCGDIHVNQESYLNNIIVAGTCLIGYIVITFMVTWIGNYILSLVAIAASTICVILLYFSLNPLMTLIVSSIFLTFCGIAATTVVTVSVNNFPTAIRTMIIIIVMTSGRLGSLIGNIIMPVLFELGCIPPFAVLSTCLIVSFIIACFFPKKSPADVK